MKLITGKSVLASLLTCLIMCISSLAGQCADEKEAERVDAWLTTHKTANIFRPGESIDVTFVFTGSGDKTLSYKVVNLLGEEKDHGEIHAADREREVNRVISFNEMGYAGIVMYMHCGDKVVEKTLSVGVLPDAPADYWNRDAGSPFGIWITIKSDYLKELGIKWERSGAYWEWYEQKKGQPDKGYLSNQILGSPEFEGIKKGYEQANINWYWFCGRPPAWAIPPASRKENVTNNYAPGDWDAFRAFLRAFLPAMNPYMGRVWESANELIPPWGWQDTLQSQVDLQRVTYDEVKTFDRHIKVTSPSYTTGELDLVNKILDLGLGKYMDILAFHPYPKNNMNPERFIVGEMKALKQAMAKHYLHKDIWVTEFAWFPKINVELYPWESNVITEKQQAEYLVRAHVLLLSEGVKLISWWPSDIRNIYLNNGNVEVKDATVDAEGKSAALMHSEPYTPDPMTYYWPKPAAIAYGIMTRNLYKSKYLYTLDYLGKDSHCCVFEKRGKPIIVAWNASGEYPVGITVDAPSVVITDMMGNTRKVSTKNGLLNVSLSTSPIYIHGASMDDLPKRNNQQSR